MLGPASTTVRGLQRRVKPPLHGCGRKAKIGGGIPTASSETKAGQSQHGRPFSLSARLPAALRSATPRVRPVLS